MNPFYDLLRRVLNTPDPPEMIGINGRGRGHHLVYAGTLPEPKRDTMKRDLGQAYAQWRCQDAGQDYSKVVSINRRRNLRLA